MHSTTICRFKQLEILAQRSLLGAGKESCNEAYHPNSADCNSVDFCVAPCMYAFSNLNNLIALGNQCLMEESTLAHKFKEYRSVGETVSGWGGELKVLVGSVEFQMVTDWLARILLVGVAFDKKPLAYVIEESAYPTAFLMATQVIQNAPHGVRWYRGTDFLNKVEGYKKDAYGDEKKLALLNHQQWITQWLVYDRSAFWIGKGLKFVGWWAAPDSPDSCDSMGQTLLKFSSELGDAVGKIAADSTFAYFSYRFFSELDFESKSIWGNIYDSTGAFLFAAATGLAAFKNHGYSAPKAYPKIVQSLLFSRDTLIMARLAYYIYAG